MSDRPLSHIRQLVALCMLAAAVVTIGLAIAGALTGARSPVPQLASFEQFRSAHKTYQSKIIATRTRRFAVHESEGGTAETPQPR
jgi:hypothetical protein